MVTLLNNGERRNKMRKFMVLLMVCSAFGLIGCDNGTTNVNNGNENQGGGGNQTQTGTITITVTGTPDEHLQSGRNFALSLTGPLGDPSGGEFADDIIISENTELVFTFESMSPGNYFMEFHGIGTLPRTIQSRQLVLGNNTIPFSDFQ